jgi:hypothetical protein
MSYELYWGNASNRVRGLPRTKEVFKTRVAAVKKYLKLARSGFDYDIVMRKVAKRGRK